MNLSELLLGGWGEAISDAWNLGTEMVTSATETVRGYINMPPAADLDEEIIEMGGGSYVPPVPTTEAGSVELGVRGLKKNSNRNHA